MRRILILSFVGISIFAEPPERQRSITEIPQVKKPLVGTLFLPLDDPTVKAAQACVSKNLPLLKIHSVISASQLSVSGVTVALRCNISGEDGQESWEFIVSRKANGAWRLKSARNLENK